MPAVSAEVPHIPPPGDRVTGWCYHAEAYDLGGIGGSGLKGWVEVFYLVLAWSLVNGLPEKDDGGNSIILFFT